MARVEQVNGRNTIKKYDMIIIETVTSEVAITITMKVPKIIDVIL